MKPELAILGGSFDPPHVGHVFLAAYALSVAGVERVLVAPTFEHAFGKPLRDFDHRMHMCELAFLPLRDVEVLELERELGGVSRTLRLLTALEARYPDHQLRLLVGADILLEAARWQSFDEICRRAPLLVAGRGGYTRPPSAESAHALLLPEVSSSEIRRAIAGGDQAIEGWLPKRVRVYIKEHALYREPPP
jgi:nicotinate-nucleotide adenylyltransferase